MNWPLYDSWCIETTEPDSAVIRRVEARVGDIGSDGPEGSTLFEGAVQGNEFCLFRIARSKNLFLPVIRGKVLSAPGGAVVKVKMRPHGYALTCLSVWYGIIILLPLYSIWSGQLEKSRWLALLPGAVIAAVLMGVVAVVLFGYEARRAREALTEVVRGAQRPAAPDPGRM
jgi:hypothetical protein